MTELSSEGPVKSFEHYGSRVLAVFAASILTISGLMLYHVYVENNVEAASSLMEVVSSFLFPVTAVTLGLLFMDTVMRKQRRAKE